MWIARLAPRLITRGFHAQAHPNCPGLERADLSHWPERPSSSGDGSYFAYCFPRGIVQFSVWVSNRRLMNDKADVCQGTLGLMVLKTLEALGPLHGYGIARRIEQTSGNLLSVNYGTIYPALLKLEQEGYIASEWGVSDNNRKAKYYKLRRAGRRKLEKETRDWEQTTAILARFLSLKEQSS
jgi:PadR family transcriptional regulator PadR